MSPKRCIVKGCDSISGKPQHKGVTFHTFPFNSSVRDIWITNCQLSGTAKSVTKLTVVCSRHFRRADFQPLKNNKYFLKPGASPSIFPWGSLPYKEPEMYINSEMDESSAHTCGAFVTDSVSDIEAAKSKEVSAIIDKILEVSAANEATNRQIKQRISGSPTKMYGKSSGKQQKPKQLDSILFVPGNQIEAQDFNEIWHNAKVVEVDNDEREVLIHFEKKNKTKSPGIFDEWIPMNSIRLRPIQLTQTTVKKLPVTYVEGEKCMARWTDSRKFPAMVHKVLENNTYEILFEDGFVKNCKSIHMSKLKNDSQKETNSPSKKHSVNPIPKFDLSLLNLVTIPRDGEWCCHWVNDTPIGSEGYLDGPDGHKRPTVLVEDWRLPNGWTKHLYQRSSVSGKWDVVLVGPTKKRFRSKTDVKLYLDEHGEIYNPDVYDFSIHKRRAKDIGCFIYTDDYKKMLMEKQKLEMAENQNKSTTTVTSPPANDLKEKSFAGFVPTTSEITDKLHFLDSNINDIVIPETYKNSTVENKNYSNDNSTNNILIDNNYSLDVVNEPVSDVTVQSIAPGTIYIGSLKVQIVDNLFRCPEEQCNKKFRKENHLQIHVKHSHGNLAKKLGVCPNMTDLAYLRTIGQPNEDNVPKNQIPNSQFFEKVYQSDMQSKSHRKIATVTNIHQHNKMSYDKPSTLIPVNDLKNLEANISTSPLKRKLFDDDINVDESQHKKKYNLLDEIINNENLSDSSFSLPQEIHSPNTPITSVDTTIDSEITLSTPLTSSKCIVSTPLIADGTMSCTSSNHSINVPSIVDGHPPELLLDSEMLDEVPKKYTNKQRMGIKMKSKLKKTITKKLNTTRRTKSLMVSRKILPTISTTITSSTITSTVPQRNDSITDYDETVSSFKSEPNDSTDTKIIEGVNIRNQRYKFLKLQSSLDSKQGFGEVSNNIEMINNNNRSATFDMIHDQNDYRNGPKYINENGELIKIVSMRQEEIINCLCSYTEEDGLMIQCELCLCWQHGICNGIEKESQVPDKYVCFICKNPVRARQSMKYVHDQDWLYEGKLSHANYHRPNKKHIDRFDTLKYTHMLTGNLLEIRGFIHSLQVKINIAEKRDHPKMYLWSKSWENCQIFQQDEHTNKTQSQTHFNNYLNVNNQQDLLSSKRGIKNKIENRLKLTPDKEEDSKKTKPNIPQPEAAINPIDCQRRLLEHLQKQQALTFSRLQSIETTIIELEAMDHPADVSYELHDSYTKTKQTVYMLINDLNKLRRLSFINNAESTLAI